MGKVAPERLGRCVYLNWHLMLVGVDAKPGLLTLFRINSSSAKLRKLGI